VHIHVGTEGAESNRLGTSTEYRTCGGAKRDQKGTGDPACSRPGWSAGVGAGNKRGVRLQRGAEELTQVSTQALPFQDDISALPSNTKYILIPTQNTLPSNKKFTFFLKLTQFVSGYILPLR